MKDERQITFVYGFSFSGSEQGCCLLFFSQICGKGVGIRVLLIGGVFFAGDFLPIGCRKGREERVCVLPRMMDMGEVEFVRQWQRLAIDHAAADDENLRRVFG